MLILAVTLLFATPTPDLVASTRVLVLPLSAVELSPQQKALFDHCLVLEVDKRGGLAAVTQSLAETDDVEACPTTETTCLSKLANALGADEVVLTQEARLANGRVLTLKRIRIRDGEIMGAVTRPVTGDHGEELLLVLGDAVAELFSECPLRPDAVAGVPPSMAERFHPPPLPRWAFAASAGATALAFGTGLTYAMLANDARRAHNRLATQNTVIDGHELQRLARLSNERQSRATLAYVATALFAVTTGVSYFFTDWREGLFVMPMTQAGAEILAIGVGGRYE